MNAPEIVAVDRKNTDSLKWDYTARFFGAADREILPLWVADMDYAIPREVTDAIKNRLNHPVYGYTVRPRSYYETLAAWQEERNGWKVDPGWIIYVPGVVAAINIAITLFSKPGEQVVLQPPVYAPFFQAIAVQGRETVENPLRHDNRRYTFDIDDLLRKITDTTKILLLCSPHNPVGRVWAEEELLELGEVCSRKGILIISDEIHSDIIMPGYRHRCIASLSDELAACTITLTSIGKTFNCAGLTTASAIIPDDRLRERFNSYIQATGLGISNIFGMTAHIACYRHGAPWVSNLRKIIDTNRNMVTNFIREKMPRLGITDMEATYLLWIDISGLGVGDKELKDRLVADGGIALEAGSGFGTGGAGHLRMNLAASEETLRKALDGFKRVYDMCKKPN